MSVSDEVVSRNFADSTTELVIGGMPVSALAATFGTPLFAYAGDVVDRAWRRLRHALPDRFDIHYSVKANPNPALIRRLIGHGAGVEIASAGELHLALTAGASVDRIVFAGPGKSDEELELAVERRIAEIHVESVNEVDRVAAVAQRRGVRAGVGLRVNPRAEAQGGAMRMGGVPAPFGIDEEDVPGALAKILDTPTLEFRGLHMFNGTQILDHGTLVRQYRKALELAGEAGKIAGHAIATLDVGGGLGIPYLAAERPLDLDELAIGVRALLAESAGDALAPTRWVVEPGRYLVGESGVYLARVVDVKTSRGKRFLILDGGMNHHLAASGNLGQVIKRNFPVVVANRLKEPLQSPVDVVGPLCTPLDMVGRDIELPDARIGDLVAILQAGAYARAASPLGFLSHATPPEVLVDGGRARLIRRRGRLDDLVRDVVDD